MPNLFSFRPVEIYGCVLASISGLTRIEIGASRLSSHATSEMRSSSEIDSTLKHLIPNSNA